MLSRQRRSPRTRVVFERPTPPTEDPGPKARPTAVEAPPIPVSHILGHIFTMLASWTFPALQGQLRISLNNDDPTGSAWLFRKIDEAIDTQCVDGVCTTTDPDTKRDVRVRILKEAEGVYVLERL